MYSPNLNDLPLPPSGKIGWPWTKESAPLPPIMPDGKQWPKISIVTPSYNQGQFLEETIRSVLLQGYPNIEYIIIDGGSTDITLSIIKKYEKWLTYWISEVDLGQSHAINKGFSKCTGQIVAWLNSDDHYLPCAFQTITKASLDYPDAGGWIGGTRQIEFQTGKVIWERMPPPLTYIDLVSGENYYPTQPSCFLNRSIVGDDLHLNESYHMQMDFDLWLKVAKKHKLIPIKNALSVGYTHPDCKTFRPELKSRSIAERWTILLNHEGLDYTTEAIEKYLRGDMELLYLLKKLSNHKLLKAVFPIIKSLLRRVIYR